ncbi:MAG: hypothetical protein HXX80_01630 [Nitrososphaerales archaeon]|nr:hypothetical protein [Nitrososphaerales archaeon]
MARNKRLLIFGVIVSAIFVMIGCVWLSSSAETLDMIAEHYGVSERPFWIPLVPGYELPGFEGNIIANMTIGITFTLLILGFTLLVGKALKAER